MTARTPVRVGVFVTGAFVHPTYFDAVSGHVQIPLKCAEILSGGGWEVTLVTTRATDATHLPYDLLDKLEVCVVQHASCSWPKHRVYLGKALVQVVQLWMLLKKRRFDIVHFFGGTATGQLLCLLKAMGIPSTVVYSPIQRPPAYRSRLGSLTNVMAFRRIDRILATTAYVANAWACMVGKTNVGTLCPGIMKEFPLKCGTGNGQTVLFWRDARHENGVDIAIRSFQKVAPRYPHVRFVFAVRPRDEYEDALIRLSREIQNVDVHIYPYCNGVSLAGLLSDALFVVQPFRQLSVNPQMCILETLYAGVPVITTEIESNPEVVHHEENGLLIPPDDEASLTAAIERLLCDECLLAELSRSTRPSTQRQWNWDIFASDLLRTYDELRQYGRRYD